MNIWGFNHLWWTCHILLELTCGCWPAHVLGGNWPGLSTDVSFLLLWWKWSNFSLKVRITFHTEWVWQYCLYYADDSFTSENIRDVLSKTKNKELVLSTFLAEANESRLEDCIKSHPCLSWSVFISILLKAKEKEAANYIFQNHDFHIKGTHFLQFCLLNSMPAQTH